MWKIIQGGYKDIEMGTGMEIDCCGTSKVIDPQENCLNSN